MGMYDIIKKKRDGGNLTSNEIKYFVNGYTCGEIPDYQVSALLMAIYFKKMTEKETFDLTKAMINSGEKVDLSYIDGIKVDKHSTGGVGDKTTIALGPMIAACGVPFIKMSGRGLGHTGGTLDKLESIKGFRVNLSKDELVRNVNSINIGICSQTANITPADKKLYSLRDVTGTVENISLIASSIMSKKLAINSNGIVLDIKVGSGAFMKNLDDALCLAKEMVKIGTKFGRETIGIITNMDEPLGNAIGNSLEVKEAIDTLKGKGSQDFHEVCMTLGSRLLMLAGKCCSEEQGRDMLLKVISNGKAYQKLLELVKCQGGDIKYIENPELFPKAKYLIELKSEKNGFIKSIDAEEIGKCCLYLGAGREVKDSKIDLTVGIILNKKVDDEVKVGDIIGYVYSNNLDKANQVINKMKNIINIGQKNEISKKLIYGEVTRNGVRLF